MLQFRYNAQGLKLRNDAERENKIGELQRSQKESIEVQERGETSVVTAPSKKSGARRRLELLSDIPFDRPSTSQQSSNNSPNYHLSDSSSPGNPTDDNLRSEDLQSDVTAPSKESGGRRRQELVSDIPFDRPSTSQQSSSNSPNYHLSDSSSPGNPADDNLGSENVQSGAALLEEPAAPKEIQKNAIAKVIEIQPLLARFLDHLLSVEGGCRGPKPSKEAQWRVGRLLYEVDETLANVKLLWSDDAMVRIRKTFIEGNRLLAKPRKVGTLRAYLTALQMFYNFLLTRATSLAKEFGLEQKDLDLIKEFHGRVSNWMKSFTEESASRKTEVHHEDFNSLLTRSQIWNLFNSPVHDKFEKQFEDLNDPEAEFVELRDYLLTMLLVQSAQRPGAVCNLTINEFLAGQWDESTGVKQFVTLTKRHKTAGMFSRLSFTIFLMKICNYQFCT